MEDKDFLKIYEKIVDEQEDILQKSSKIKQEFETLKKDYAYATESEKQIILQRLKTLDEELEDLEKRSILNSKRAKKLKEDK